MQKWLKGALPNPTTQGVSIDEALANLKEATELYLVESREHSL